MSQAQIQVTLAIAEAIVQRRDYTLLTFSTGEPTAAALANRKAA